jgi:hypothetical protein
MKGDKIMKKTWLWLLTMVSSMLPTLAWAGESIHASGFLRPLILICVVLLFVIVIVWALRYWASEIPTPLGKVVTFAVIFIALIIILIILLGVAGIHIS